MIEPVMDVALAAGIGTQPESEFGAEPGKGFGDLLGVLLTAASAASINGEAQGEAPGDAAQPPGAAARSTRAPVWGTGAANASARAQERAAANSAVAKALSAAVAADTDADSVAADAAQVPTAAAEALVEGAPAAGDTPDGAAVQEQDAVAAIPHNQAAQEGEAGETATAQNRPTLPVEAKPPVETAAGQPSSRAAQIAAERVAQNQARQAELSEPGQSGADGQTDGPQAIEAAQARAGQVREGQQVGASQRAAQAASHGIEGAEQPAAPAAPDAPAAPHPFQAMAASTLRRVMEAIESAERRPPPNTMAVDLPGEGAGESLRLIITVRGGEVQVSGGSGQDGLPPGWARPLADALAQRGLTLGGGGADGSRNGSPGSREDGSQADSVPAGAARPAWARAAALSADDGALRL